MSFASDERLYKHLGLRPGSVTPLSLFQESAKEVIAVFDSDIFTEDKIHFHPLRNTATVLLQTSDFKKYLESLSQDIREICF